MGRHEGGKHARQQQTGDPAGQDLPQHFGYGGLTVVGVGAGVGGQVGPGEGGTTPKHGDYSAAGGGDALDPEDPPGDEGILGRQRAGHLGLPHDADEGDGDEVDDEGPAVGDVADRVEGILGTIADPNLPPNTVDLAIMVDVYHELSHPYEMTVKMVEGLKPGGLLVFVEYRMEDPSVQIKRLHKMTEAQVKKEMAVQHLEFVETIDALPQQHIVIFRKPE